MAYEVTYDGEKDHFYIMDLNKIQGIEVYDFEPDRVLPIPNEGKFYLELYKKKKEDIMVEVKLK